MQLFITLGFILFNVFYLFVPNLKIVIFDIFTTIILLLYFILDYLPIISNGSSLSKNICSTTGITK